MESCDVETGDRGIEEIAYSVVVVVKMGEAKAIWIIGIRNLWLLLRLTKSNGDKAYIVSQIRHL